MGIFLWFGDQHSFIAQENWVEYWWLMSRPIDQFSSSVTFSVTSGTIKIRKALSSSICNVQIGNQPYQNCPKFTKCINVEQYYFLIDSLNQKENRKCWIFIGNENIEANEIPMHASANTNHRLTKCRVPFLCCRMQRQRKQQQWKHFAIGPNPMLEQKEVGRKMNASGEENEIRKQLQYFGILEYKYKNSIQPDRFSDACYIPHSSSSYILYVHSSRLQTHTLEINRNGIYTWIQNIVNIRRKKKSKRFLKQNCVLGHFLISVFHLHFCYVFFSALLKLHLLCLGTEKWYPGQGLCCVCVHMCCTFSCER